MADTTPRVPAMFASEKGDRPVFLRRFAIRIGDSQIGLHARREIVSLQVHNHKSVARCATAIKEHV
ncbi:hypothetical protein [Rhodovulum euryhalinum]|uniref:Uncharacterized protein n=1 Tax=Rhodovulum euryhalinum TaxID=35805 RepID=A0A4R2KNX3_9RHOB|nr:hypothetical protein [Rhodovulum euryhalinum]TCO68285.1 hypothetical protein EV655_1299 [Rhodovulum euryhalinum]